MLFNGHAKDIILDHLAIGSDKAAIDELGHERQVVLKIGLVSPRKYQDFVLFQIEDVKIVELVDSHFDSL